VDTRSDAIAISMAVDVTVEVGALIRCPMDERDVAVKNREIDEILIYYSSSHWQEMLSAAKAFAQALGLAVTDTGRSGVSPSKNSTGQWIEADTRKSL
jgi:hypothetical protein